MACPGFVRACRSPQFAWLAVALALALAACGNGDDDGPGTPIDAATDPPIDAADDPSIDAGDPDASASTAAEINCGTDTCDRATQICCFTGFPNITTTCTATDACSDLPGRCDGPEDCTEGTICCGEQAGSSCKAAALCTGFAASQLCHSEADCPGDPICRPSDFVAWPICAAP